MVPVQAEEEAAWGPAEECSSTPERALRFKVSPSTATQPWAEMEARLRAPLVAAAAADWAGTAAAAVTEEQRAVAVVAAGSPETVVVEAQVAVAVAVVRQTEPMRAVPLVEPAPVAEETAGITRLPELPAAQTAAVEAADRPRMVAMAASLVVPAEAEGVTTDAPVDTAAEVLAPETLERQEARPDSVVVPAAQVESAALVGVDSVAMYSSDREVR